jgi:hypothetical protein
MRRRRRCMPPATKSTGSKASSAICAIRAAGWKPGWPSWRRSRPLAGAAGDAWPRTPRAGTPCWRIRRARVAAAAARHEEAAARLPDCEDAVQTAGSEVTEARRALERSRAGPAPGRGRPWPRPARPGEPSRSGAAAWSRTGRRSATPDPALLAASQEAEALAPRKHVSTPRRKRWPGCKPRYPRPKPRCAPRARPCRPRTAA